MQSTQLTVKSQIVSDILEMCAIKGVMCKSNNDPQSVDFSHCALSMLPTPFPLKLYNQAKDLQPYMAMMVSDLVHQPNQIHEILRFFQEQDPFLKRLIGMSKIFNEQEIKQDIHMLILRSDYMIDKFTNALKLVEFNTIASSLSSPCQRIREIQSYIMDKYSDVLQFNYGQTNEHDDGLSSNNIGEMAKIFNRTVEKYVESMATKYPELA